MRLLGEANSLRMINFVPAWLALARGIGAALRALHQRLSPPRRRRKQMKTSLFAGTLAIVSFAATTTLAAQQLPSGGAVRPDTASRHASLGVRADLPFLDMPFNLT